MNFVDLLLLASLAIVAVIGWRSGLIATAMGFAGFLLGALAGAMGTPALLADRELPLLLNTLLVLLAMVVLGVLGHAVFSWAGRRVREAISFTPVRVLDSLGGLAVSALAFLAAAWLLLSVVATLPVNPAAQVRDSRSYTTLERYMSGPTDGLLDQVRGVLASLELPQIPFNEALLPPVADPSELRVAAAAKEVANQSVLSVAASSPRCSRRSSGSAVVLGPELVATNAHVVTGAQDVTVTAAGSRNKRAAVPIYLDRNTDIAILRVPGLAAPAPVWVDRAARGVEAVVAGYPLGGPLRTRPALVRGMATVPGDDGGPSREVYVFRGRVQPGNSGGGLLDSRGRVIGLVFANAQDDEETGFALTAEMVRDAQEAAAGRQRPVTTGKCPA